MMGILRLSDLSHQIRTAQDDMIALNKSLAIISNKKEEL